MKTIFHYKGFKFSFIFFFALAVGSLAAGYFQFESARVSAPAQLIPIPTNSAFKNCPGSDRLAVVSVRKDGMIDIKACENK